MPKFEYAPAAVSDLIAKTETNPKTGKKTVTHIIHNDREFVPSKRFFTSLFARFGFSESIFTYFDHEEVFNRISEKRLNNSVRLCIEISEDPAKEDTLLAVSLPSKPVVAYDDLVTLLESYNTEQIRYHDGIVESVHTPRVGASQFQIGGDDFTNRFMMASPIDGYGTPNLYLMMLREICQNGAVAMAKTFKSSLALGKGADDVGFAITRALDGFNNDEGFAALRQRFEASTKSWASVNECQRLYELLVRLQSNAKIGTDGASLLPTGMIYKTLHQKTRQEQFAAIVNESDLGDLDDKVINSPILKAFHKVTGDMSELYGLATMESLSIKRQRTLPTKATVYDLINLASEVATHYSRDNGGRLLQAHLGTLVSSEFDMENTMDQYKSFDDFLIDRRIDGDVSKDLEAASPGR